MALFGFFKELYKTFVLHAVAAHFNNGLVPVATLFLVLALVTGDEYYEHTVLHLAIVALCMVPISFLSGIRDWRIKFNAVRAPIFYRKIGLTALLLILGGCAVVIRITHPGVLGERGVLACLYFGCLFGSLPVVILLGHYGGKLVFAAKENH